MKKLLLLLVVLLMAITVVGCQSAPQAEAAPVEAVEEAAPAVDPTPEPDPLVFTFDGETCTYEGPTTISTGLVPVMFYNNGEEMARVGGVRLVEGKTWDDLIAYWQENGPESQPPDWAIKEASTNTVLGGGESKSSIRLVPGEYGFFCTTVSPSRGWPGTPLTVEE
ncbi:MAG: hypothetical protein JXJ17_18750 [Anaerolineae bacterium]|nr:hypothetical protein [Anaerolineae bacterium]